MLSECWCRRRKGMRSRHQECEGSRTTSSSWEPLRIRRFMGAWASSTIIARSPESNYGNRIQLAQGFGKKKVSVCFWMLPAFPMPTLGEAPSSVLDPYPSGLVLCPGWYRRIQALRSPASLSSLFAPCSLPCESGCKRLDCCLLRGTG